MNDRTNPDPGAPETDGPDRGDAESDPISAIGSLAEPSRRRLYDHIVSDGGWVSRDSAADATGIQRGTAAHHLDRLADDGLLEVDYRRLTGRTGPGAGRPAKLYRRAGSDLQVALPPRAYDSAGRMLADAVDDAISGGEDVAATVRRSAGSEGARLAEAIRQRLDTRPAAATRDVILEVLSDHGYEPRVLPDDTVVLHNCPFHELAQTHTELICGMNHELIRSALDKARLTTLHATLEPQPGQCCVVLRPGPGETDGCS